MKRSLFALLLLLPLLSADAQQLEAPRGLWAQLMDVQTGETRVQWLPPQAPPDCCLFYDSFSNGTPDGWIFTHPALWSEQNGTLRLNLPFGQAGTRELSDALLTTVSLQDYIADFDFVVNGEMNRFDFIQLYINANGLFGDGNQSDYSGTIIGFNPSNGTFYIHRRTVGSLSPEWITPSALDTDALNSEPGELNHVTVFSQFGKMRLYFNDQQVFGWEPDTLEAGSIGLGLLRYSCNPLQLNCPTMQIDHADDYYHNITRYNAYAFDHWWTGVDGRETFEFTDVLAGYQNVPITLLRQYYTMQSPRTDPFIVHRPEPSASVFLETFDQGLPPSWTLEQSIATISWSWTGIPFAGMQTQHMLFVRAEYYVSIYSADLISPEIYITSLDHPLLLFDSYLEDDQIWQNLSQIYIGTQDDEWTLFYTMDLPEDLWSHMPFVLQLDDFVGEPAIRIKFRSRISHPDVEYYWHIDNVRVTGRHPSSVLSVDLASDHMSLPRNGGPFDYTVTLINRDDLPHDGLTFWTIAEFPDGSSSEVLVEHPLSLQPVMSITGAITQLVPPTAPAGSYRLIANLGVFPMVEATDTLQLFKSAATLSPIDTDHDHDKSWMAHVIWDSESPLIKTASGTQNPIDFQFTDVAPNPFNASTTIRVQLPNQGDLKLSVYNTLGQQVCTLANGPLHAGEHAFALDGSTLASGIYVVLAEHGGHSVTRKIVLMK